MSPEETKKHFIPQIYEDPKEEEGLRKRVRWRFMNNLLDLLTHCIEGASNPNEGAGIPGVCTQEQSDGEPPFCCLVY